MVTQEQARRSAQYLFPQLWQSNPTEAVAQAIVFIYETANEDVQLPKAAPSRVNHAKPVNTTGVVKILADHMSRHRLHVNVVARAIGVSGYTVRTWLEGKYQPNEDNSEKIAKFISNMNSTPEILTAES